MPQAMTGLTGWLQRKSINKRLTIQSVSTGAFGLLLIATIAIGSYFSMQMIDEGDRNANAALTSALLEKDFASLERDAFRHALVQDGDTEEGYRGNVTDLGTSIDDTRSATNADQVEHLSLVETLADDYVRTVDGVIAAGRTGKDGVAEIMESGDKVDAAIETVRDETIALSAATTVEKQVLEQWVMGVTIAIALLIAVVSYLMSSALKKLIGGELEDLRNAIAEIEAGHLQLAVPHIERNDEIGELARASDRLRQARLAADEKDQATASMIEKVSDRLTALAEGDLTVKLNDVDASFSELRDAFNRSVSRLRETMDSVASSADSVRSGSMEISQASEDLAQRTESQAVDLTRMTEKMTEMSNGMAETAEAASKAASGVDAAVSEARHGGEVVSRAIKAMSTIEGSTHEIGKIISVIDGISFQTNLLALNAGVEAARAGEVGRGFAVVASEVRELAQRSSNAAEEIRQLIGASTEQVASGVTLVRETGEALDKIIEKIAEVTQIATQISSATGSQSHNLKDANKVMTGIDQMTQQNAAMGEESNAAARRLAEEADNLTRMVQSFRFSDGAKSMMAGAMPAPVTSIAPSEAEPQEYAAPARSAPPRVSGNLALAEEPAEFDADDNDWAEF